MIDYSTEQLSQMIGCTSATVRNWMKSGWLTPYQIDQYGNARFSEEQYNGIKEALPLPKYSERKEWLSRFSIETERLPHKEPSPDDYYAPPVSVLTRPNRNTLYDTKDPNASQKISAIVEKSNQLLAASWDNKCNIRDPEELAESTMNYFSFCQANGIMPSMRRLANWYGYSFKQLYRLIEKQSPEGIYLDKIRDAIKDMYEQAALVNAVNNISAMFILKSQYDYVEANKVIIEPSESLLGQPKSPEEIASYIDADIVDD